MTLRPFKLIPPLLALSALAACAANAPMASLSPAASASAPAPVADHDWFFDRDRQQLTLAYGVANSDDLKLQLVCQTGTGALELAAVFDRPSRVLLLESGGDTERYAARSEPAGIHEGQYVTASAKTKDPVFQRFRSLGWIALWEGDEREPLASHPEGKASVERFFAACG